MDILPPDDGLQGLAPVEPRHVAGIMPNAAHQTFHGFMTGAPYELAIVEFDDQGRCYDRGQMDGVANGSTRWRQIGRSQGQDVILVVFVHGWQHDARSDDDNLSAFRVLLSETVDYEKATRLGRRRAASGPWRLCRLARPVGVWPGRRRRGRHVLGAAGGRTAGGGRIGARVVREAAPLSQPPAEGRRKPASGDRGPQLRRHDRLFRPRAVAHPGGLRAGRQSDAGIRRPGAAGESGDRGRAFHPDLRSGDERCLQGPHDEAASGLHLRAGRERSAGGNGVSARQCRPRDRRSDDRGLGEVVRHPRARLRAELPHPRFGWPDGERALRAERRPTARKPIRSGWSERRRK